MLTDFFATKLGMTQAWTKSGKRLAITRCKASDLPVVSVSTVRAIDTQANNKPQHEVIIAEVGLGKKKLANMSKPLREKMTKSGFSLGAKQLRGLRIGSEQAVTIIPGSSISVDQVLAVGDVVQVQGVTKGRGFAGAVKRYGFHGGPKTHGQSDRTRAVGSIGPGTTPGRVFIGKKMPGRFGGDIKTVSGLVVVHINPVTKEIWLSGPVPGVIFSQVKIRKTGESKDFALETEVSGLVIPTESDEAITVTQVEAETEVEAKAEATPESAPETTKEV
ncbi:MAG: 50S ribosomal protein L3 [Candidatus Pacebacteria bacterium CG10_big_fil_rev_8_21_14_0_10_44_11]|nr:MAG: 50S ribosomal protein L3 [Candidatus Pacebacteria bacterium CG10_big_fil_rev_8_21_14_0_10_44_11]